MATSDGQGTNVNSPLIEAEKVQANKEAREEVQEAKHEEETDSAGPASLLNPLELNEQQTSQNSSREVGQPVIGLNVDRLLDNILEKIKQGYSWQHESKKALKKKDSDEFKRALIQQKEPFITVNKLKSLYKKILDSGRPISKVLKKMRKRKPTAEMDLLDVGRILHLLLGPMYKVMYTKVNDSKAEGNILIDVTSCKELGLDQRQLWHLFLWSVLTAQPDMTQFFLMQMSSPLGASLLAFRLYSKLAFYSNKFCEQRLADTLKSAADHFQGFAVNILDNMYDEIYDNVSNTDVSEVYRILVSELPSDLGLGHYITPLLIADDSRAVDFMSHYFCQTYLRKVWNGNIAVKEENDKEVEKERKPLYDQKKNSQEMETFYHFYDPKEKAHTFQKAQLFFTAPFAKFYATMFAYLCFLALLSYVVLTVLKPVTSCSEIECTEWFLIVWEMMLIVEEIVQLVNMSYIGPSVKEPGKLDNTIWRKREKCGIRTYFFNLYLRSDRWNKVDLTMIVLFITSTVLRFTLPLETFQMARIVVAVTVIVCYFRLLRFGYVLPTLGPRIIAIQKMLIELVNFLIVLVVFVFGFGVAFQAILNPNQSPSWSTFSNILYRTYWQMFGELFLEDEDQAMGRDVSAGSCQAMASNESLYVNGTQIVCYEWAAPVLLAIYLLISSVLLLNLLIAIFGMALEKTDYEKLSKYNFHSLVQESFYQEWLPPPISILAHITRCILYIVKRCRRQKRQKRTDCFRVNPNKLTYELQKKAIKDIKIFEENSTHSGS